MEKRLCAVGEGVDAELNEAGAEVVVVGLVEGSKRISGWEGLVMILPRRGVVEGIDQPGTRKYVLVVMVMFSR